MVPSSSILHPPSCILHPRLRPPSRILHPPSSIPPPSFFLHGSGLHLSKHALAVRLSTGSLLERRLPSRPSAPTPSLPVLPTARPPLTHSPLARPHSLCSRASPAALLRTPPGRAAHTAEGGEAAPATLWPRAPRSSGAFCVSGRGSVGEGGCVRGSMRRGGEGRGGDSLGGAEIRARHPWANQARRGMLSCARR